MSVRGYRVCVSDGEVRASAFLCVLITEWFGLERTITITDHQDADFLEWLDNANVFACCVFSI